MGGGSADESTGKVKGEPGAGAAGTGDGAAGGGDDGPPSCRGTLPHDASVPTIAVNNTCHRKRFMVLILLEALGALILLVLIVWWTMFSGRDKGELPGSHAAGDTHEERGSDGKP